MEKATPIKKKSKALIIIGTDKFFKNQNLKKLLSKLPKKKLKTKNHRHLFPRKKGKKKKQSSLNLLIKLSFFKNYFIHFLILLIKSIKKAKISYYLPYQMN